MKEEEEFEEEIGDEEDDEDEEDEDMMVEFGGYVILSDEDDEDDVFKNEDVGKWVNEWKSKSKETIKKFKEGLNELSNDEKKGEEIIRNSQLVFPSAFTHRHYVYYAQILQTLSKFEEEILILHKALQFKNINKNELIEIYLRLALLYALLDSDEAVFYFEKSLLIDPINVFALQEFSRYWQRLGEEKKGEKILKNAIKIAPKNEEIYQIFAAYLAEEERFNEAIEVLEKIEKTTNNTEILSDMANYYHQLERFDEAILYYKRTLEIDNQLNEVRYSYAQLLIILMKYEEAIEECKIIIENESDFYDAYDAMALSYFNIKNFQLSIENWEKLIGIENELFNTRADIGLAYIKLKNYKKAEEIIKIDLEKEISSSYPLFAYGIVLYKLGNFQSSIDYFNRAKNFNFKDSNDELILNQCLDDLYCYYAKCLMKLNNGNEKEIFYCLNLSIQSNEGYSKAYYQLAKLYLKINPKNIENAKKNFLIAMEKNKILLPISSRFSHRCETKIIEILKEL